MTCTLVSALLPLFAPQPLFSGTQPKKIHDDADPKTSQPIDEPIGKPNVNENSHNNATTQHTSS
jgi:hypothetical protein